MKTVKKVAAIAVSLLLVSLLALPLTLGVQAKGESTVNSNAGISFAPGTMTLMEVPSFDFGNHKIKARTVEYPAKVISDSVLLEDTRGTTAGWSLKANLSTFKENNVERLKGSSIIIEPTTPTPISSRGNVPTGTPNNVELISGDQISHPVWIAKNGEGAGRWSMHLNNQNVSLKVPGGTAAEGDYRAIIEWSLMDDPAS